MSAIMDTFTRLCYKTLNYKTAMYRTAKHNGDLPKVEKENGKRRK
jgi:hypothetical protein